MKNKQLTLAALAQLEREKVVSIPQLASMLHASEDDVFDALETLVFAYDAASMRLDLHDTYATLETYGKDRLLRLTAAETDALIDALIAAGFLDDDDLVQALVRTKSVLAESDSDSKSRMRVISDMPQARISEIVAASCEDLEHHLLEISYQGIDDIEPLDRCIEPLRIFSRDGHKYVQAFCLEVEDWRSFRLDRILQAHVLEDTFDPQNNPPSPTLHIEGTGVRARIAFAADCPTPTWQGMKITRTHKDGHRVGSITWTGSTWLPKHIVGLMGKAIPLEPPSLVQECENYAKELLQAADMHDHANE